MNYPDELLPLLLQHGRHSLAWSLLQPGMRYFCDAKRGIIGYRQCLCRQTVLGDPVCPPAAAQDLLRDFSRRFPHALFMQVQQQTAEHLAALDYQITPVGVENEIDVEGFTITGKRKRDLRHYRNRATAAQVEVREEPDSLSLRQTLRPVSEAWIPTKSWFMRELEFLARPFVYEPEPYVRVFVARVHDRPVAFVVLDPIFQEGRRQGYTVTILRHLPEAPEGAVDLINLRVIDTLRDEGVPLLSLGVSPFRNISALAAGDPRCNHLVLHAFNAAERWGSPIYHFRGLSFHKSRYRAREIPVYAATRGTAPLLALLASARACKML